MLKQGSGAQVRDADKDLGRAYARRGAIYRWLRENHEFVTRWLAEKEPPWSEVAKRMATAGVVGARGNAPVGHAARRVWKRVCRDVEAALKREEKAWAEREARAEQRRGFPSRQRAVEPLLADAPVPQIKAPEPGECRALVPVSGDETAPLTARQKLGVVRGQLKQLGGTMPMAKKW